MRARTIVSLLCALALSLCAQAGTISYVQITGDADCGISTSNVYTHTLDFGQGSPGALINGVQFDAYNLAANGTLNFNRTVATGTAADHAGNANHNVTGGLVALLTDMYYNDGNAAGGGETTWTLSGLTPGQGYSTRIYSRQWGANNQRTVIFTFDPDGAGPISDVTDTINQDDATTVGMPNDNTAYYIDYEFVAVAGEDLVITVAQDLNNQSWHLYGITNQEITLGTAYLPYPADGATDVPRDVELSWKPGDDAVTHNVYFGTSYDAVLAGDASVLVSQGQTSPTFQVPEILDFSTMYYWRVDEVLSDASVLTGRVWSFESAPFTYAIQGITATSNTTSAADQGPEKTIDGSGLNESDQHSVETDDMWNGTIPTDEPAYIEYEFDRVYKLHEMLIWNYNLAFESLLGFGVKDTTIEYSIDGENWTALGDFELAQGPGIATYTANNVIAFDGLAAKFVRLTVNSSFISTSNCGLSEVRFMQIPTYAREPQPADGATGVSIDAMLDWRGGRDAVVHEVYLGTDAEAVDLVDTVNQSNYDPGTLALGTTYYWTVNEVNDVAATPVWETDLWSFTTQEFINIDGFETYTDDIEAGGTVWQTWIDGIDDNTNGGAVVGYGQSPFAEQTFVRTGGQSMPFAYNNSGVAFSETDRTFSPALDWSGGVAKTLSLYFFGAADNAAGQLYVKINGTKILYGGSAEDLKLPVWIPWTIDLAGTGANLQSVSTLSIGVEGNGSGTLFIDDVRLYGYDSELIDAVEPSDDALVAYGPLDGDATDVVGGNNGTIADGMEFTDGVVGQATDGFDLEDITVPYSDDFALNTFTVAAWVNVTDTSADLGRGIMGTRFNSDFTFDLKVGVDLIHGDIGNGTAWINTAVDINKAHGGGITLGEWHHIAYAISAEEGTADLYLDGALATTVSFSGTPLLMKPGQDLHISNSSGTEYMRGSIDELRVYNTALTEGEVAGLVGRPGPVYKGL